MIVYCATHLESGRKYVGKTVGTIDGVIKRHLKAKTYFGNVVRKYGLESFKFEVIDTAFSNEGILEKEIEWITKLNTVYPNGFNLSIGGQGYAGYKMGKESRKAMAVAKLGKPSVKRTLTLEQVKEIRDSLDSNQTLANKFGVSRGIVYYARVGKTYNNEVKA